MFNFFKKREVDFKFGDIGTAGYYTKYPPILAKDLKPNKELQEKKYGDYRFPVCPGMLDYSKMGYIIPAWITYRIKVNKAGTKVIAGNVGDDAIKRPALIQQPRTMDTTLLDGSFYSQTDYPVYNCGGPWKILSKNKNLSLLIMPAFYHSNFLNDIHVMPGVVDYVGKFYDMNFIIKPKRECEVIIKAGDPILHVIPIVMPKVITASYGKATQYEHDAVVQPKHFHEKNFYRKWYHIKKRFKLISENE